MKPPLQLLDGSINGKKLYGICEFNKIAKMLSADSESVEKFVENVQKFIKKNNVCKNQLFNCDETYLYFYMLPLKTLAAKVKSSTPGYKRRKERIAVLSCFNT